MEIQKWLDSQEERIVSALEENRKRKEFLDDELNIIRSIKKNYQGDTTEANRP